MALSGKKKRALTKLLEKAAEREIVTVKGNPTSFGKEVAGKMWEMAAYGRVVFEDPVDGEVRILEASARDWKDTVSWLFQQIDGPVKQDGSESDVSSKIREMSTAELENIKERLNLEIRNITSGIGVEDDEEVNHEEENLDDE